MGFNLTIGKLFRDELSIQIGFLYNSKFRMWKTKIDVLTILFLSSLGENIVNKKTGSSHFRDIFSKKFKLFDEALPCHLPSLLETIPESIYPRPFLCADLYVLRPYREET